ncbi:hypothetical protein EDD16DRAFT_651896 [Pisolithus croceorrhizus]|nr:hypothetical protein EDD16DRAFT_651896 [Pisolithus croceorrhizus]
MSILRLGLCVSGVYAMFLVSLASGGTCASVLIPTSFGLSHRNACLSRSSPLTDGLQIGSNPHYSLEYAKAVSVRWLH